MFILITEHSKGIKRRIESETVSYLITLHQWVDLFSLKKHKNQNIQILKTNDVTQWLANH